MIQEEIYTSKCNNILYFILMCLSLFHRSFPIYGLSCLVVEQMYVYLTARKVPLLVRGLIYTLWTYCWEFSTGFILKQFGACPWDYTPFHGDFMGLVTLEYAPLWFIGAIVNERLVMHYTRRIFIGPSIEKEEEENSRKKVLTAMSSQNGYVKQD